jgi:gliding motility-associated-like protein
MRNSSYFTMNLTTTKVIKLTALFLGLFLFTPKINAQIDQEFWFAPPDLTQGTQGEINGGAFRDRPIQLVLSTLTDPAQITIWQPANLSFSPIVVNLAANSTQTVNLTAFINQIETRFVDSVMTTGVLVRATAPITAYYELGAAANRDLVALKGKNANGTLFYTPFQTLWENARTLGGSPYIPQPRTGFVIVATDDSTTVTITPAIDILNHQAGIPFSVYLHRGQTYYCEAIDYIGAVKPAGTKIESDRPIAVTIKDDMIDLDPPPSGTEGGADLAADQLISVENCGFKHIVVRGDLANGLDKVYVCATEDNTELFIDGSATPIATLNAGQQYAYSFTAAAGFIEGSKPIYVLHISGVGDQIAGAIVPSLECTGSNQVGFTRTGSANFKLNLTIKAGFENNFTLNGDNTFITASDFQPVPGGNGEWVFCRKAFTTAQVPVGQASLIQNFSDELFHMGITYQQGASCNYGYFTNFSYLELGINRELCLGDSAVLDAGPGKTSYLWSTGDTTQKITVFDPGTYYVSVLSGNECSATDTIQVSYYTPPVTIQASRDTICEGSQLLLTVPGVYLFEWQDGSQNPFFIVDQAGVYYVDVTDFQGCRARDSIQIWTSPRPETPVASIIPFDPTITADTLCSGTPFALNMTTVANAESYAWIGPGNTLYNGTDINILSSTAAQSGEYLAFSIFQGCESFYDTLSLLINQTPEVYIGLSDTVCSVSSVLLDAGSGPGYSYLWQDNSSNQTFVVNQGGLYWVEVLSPEGCAKRDSVDLFFSVTPPAPTLSTNGNLVDNVAICSGTDLDLSMGNASGSAYYFATSSDTNGVSTTSFTFSDIQTSAAGTYYAYYIQNGCPSDVDSVVVTIDESPVFEFAISDTSICAGENLSLSAASVNGVTYLWNDNSTGSSINAASSGIYWVELENATGCTTRDSVDLEVLPRPQSPVISGDTTLCGSEALALASNQEPGAVYSWGTPAGQTAGPVLNLSTPPAGQYTLSVSLNGCEGASNASVQVSVNAIPVFSLGDDLNICTEDIAVLEGPDGVASYNWSNEETTVSIEVGGGVYSLEVIDDNGCTFSDTVIISQTGPVAAFSSDPSTGAQTGVNISFTDASTGNPVSWLWNFGDNTNASTQNTSHSYSNQGELTVLLTVTDAAGCTDTISRKYQISNSVAVPNSFTPNGDGFNDFFVVNGLGAFPSSSMAIFNRWGNEIYSVANYLNDWNGGDLPDGTYFYVLKLSNGETLTGDVTVKR